jgi:Domain of unknown function (DUF4362)
MDTQKWAWILGVILFLLTGCQESDQAAQPTDGVDSELNADVVDMHGGITGLENMENYFQQVSENTKGDLRVTHYTIEGDPIVTDLSYDGKQIHVKFDYTRDQYGNGGVDTFQCGKLKREENSTNLSYYLKECDGVQGDMWEVLTASYNVKRQDVFEVELTYGEDGKKHTIEVDEEDKQEIYKQLVLANYLNSKPSSDRCPKEEQTDSYSMNVKINGADRTFIWKSCENNTESTPFTDIAEYIIQVSENPTESSENIIYGYILSIEDNQLFIGEDLTAFDYEMVKDLKPEAVDGYIFNFLYVETDEAQDFSEGDKIAVEVDRVIDEGSPPRVSAGNIEKVNE